MTDRFATALLVALGLAIALAGILYAGEALADGPTPAWVSDAGPVVAEPVPAPPQAPIAEPASDPATFARAIYDAVRSGRWASVAGLALIAVVWAARRYIGEVFPWMQSDRGGVLLVFLASALGALANAMAAGAWPDLPVVLAALQAALVAIGGYAGARRLLWPKAAASA